MQFKITAVRTIDDPLDRARRLAALYRHFEQPSAAGDIVADEPGPAAEQPPATRPGESPAARARGKAGRHDRQ